ncbi:MAG: sulfatase-like hydrolase/transferase, partial [Clostridia bacterium]|nr:sulfatase-like hydrolase/transferase [Clostridia bacterium]
EKTDISENLSLFGSYPLDYYTNYDYANNNIAYSLPNLMEILYGVESRSFHNGNYTFYNRNEYLTAAVGFDEYIACEQMEQLAPDVFTNYFDGRGERNMDSEMIAACADMMFPTDRRFNTYITTIAMHGRYDYRDNLQPYYDKLAEAGMARPSEEDEEATAFYHYAAAAMDFDKALGMIVSELESRGLMDNTLIVLFGDHNAYYQTLTNYVKDIYPKTDRDCDVTELYRVPMMIKIGNKITQKVEIKKFTCTADIMPTIMSLLGINYYTNLYYGNSVFSRQESVLYSRAYDVFLTDKLYFNTLDNITFRTEEVTDEYLEDVENRCLTLMKKCSYINRIFASDLFGGAEGENFADNMRAINR